SRRLGMSTESKSRSIRSRVMAIFPMRNLSSMSSRLCDSSEISAKPSMPANPLSECTSRKILLTTSGRTFAPCDSNSTRSRESVSSNSSASLVNSSRARSSSRVMRSVRFRLRHLQQPPQLLDQLRRLERLHQILLGAQIRGAAAIFVARFGRDDHDRDRLVHRVVLEEAHQLEAVDVRHVDVGKDRVEGVMRERLQRFETAGRLDDLEVV